MYIKGIYVVYLLFIIIMTGRYNLRSWRLCTILEEWFQWGIKGLKGSVPSASYMYIVHLLCVMFSPFFGRLASPTSILSSSEITD